MLKPPFIFVSRALCLLSVQLFKCAPGDERLLSAVTGRVGPRLQRGMQSDSRWLACMQLWPARCKLANGVEE